MQALLVPHVVRGADGPAQGSIQEDLGPVRLLVHDLLVELPAGPVPYLRGHDREHLSRAVTDDELASLAVEVARVAREPTEVLLHPSPELRGVAAPVHELREAQVQAHLLHLIEAQGDRLALPVRLVRKGLAPVAVLPSPADPNRHVNDEVPLLVEELPAVACIGVLPRPGLERPEDPALAPARLRYILSSSLDDPGVPREDVQVLLRSDVAPRVEEPTVGVPGRRDLASPRPQLQRG